MFTGLVEEVGTFKDVKSAGEAMLLTIRAKKILEDIRIGDSIAVNGVCLTCTAYDKHTFTADVMPETYRKSTLKNMKAGDSVNVERAMSAKGRFGGHIVQGHVDGTGTVLARESDANAVVFTIRPHNEQLFRYIIATGSITIDGISLTVVNAANSSFTVSIIPHTLSETALANRIPGMEVNLECDVIGKYVDHLLQFDKQEKKKKNGSAISASYLAEHGFL